MSKGLEALEIIKGALVEVEYDEEEDIILSAWQEHEEEINIIEKELKAFEIIKNKGVEVGLVMICNTYQDYEKWYINNHVGMQKLTQEEYDLLKEVLI